MQPNPTTIRAAVLTVAIGLASCHRTEPTDIRLQDAFDGAFLIGTALNADQILGLDTAGVRLITTHFNAITPENVFKWEQIQPEPGVFVFDLQDRFVAFGEANNQYMVGHTLVWHNQTPRWVFEDGKGNLLSRDALLDRMRTHIHTVVGRYKGRIHAWDVVNEAINDDGSWRESLWYRIIGPDFVVKAFQFAREADPDAKLYYNDYSLENPAKRDGAIRLVRYLQNNDAPIDGVGTQGHFSLDWPGLDELDNTITAFSKLGIDVMVTELDLDVLPSAFDYPSAEITLRAELRDSLNPWPNGLPDSLDAAHAARYADLFRVFLKHKDAISRVTFWGVTDADSWKNNWPVPGRTNYCLIFDRNAKPKRAFHAIVETAREARK